MLLNPFSFLHVYKSTATADITVALLDCSISIRVEFCASKNKSQCPHERLFQSVLCLESSVNAVLMFPCLR